MNNQIFFFFYNFAHQSVFLDKIIIFFAVFFPYLVVLLALLFFLFFHKKWKGIILVFITSVFAWFLAHLLKDFFYTVRPFDLLPNVSSLFSETGFAFPSGHATFFSALAFSIFFLHKKAGYFFMFFALLIGLARIIAGVHFPIDILGGFILGGGISYLFAYFVKNV